MKSLAEQLGLDETQAKVYLALLQLGPASVTEVTKTANVSRTLGYYALEKLGLYGLVDQAPGEGKKLRYVAQHPRQLLQHLRNKESSWRRQGDSVEKLLPDLVSMYKVAEKPTIRYQEGKKGVISIFEESFDAQNDILSILDVESWKSSELWDWAETYNKRRNRAKVKERILILDTKEGRAKVDAYSSSKTYTEYRWVKPEDVKDLLQFGGEINMYNNKVVIALLEKPNVMGIVIESKVLSNILRAMFELIWKQAEPVIFSKKK